MEKKTLLLVIGGIVVFAFAFILLAILVSEFSSKSDRFELPEFLNSSSCPKDFEPLPLILVSLDGFHPDYLKRGVTPTLQKMIDNGASAPYMTSSFPTLTFPNHYSIVTGLYPESHGIISNGFYDSKFGAYFSYKTPEVRKGKWWGGEPIWNTVIKHGLKSATYFWPGSEAPIGGMYPTYFRNYSSDVILRERIDQVLGWLSLPEPERPSWISVYSSQPDSAGHKYGPNSDEVTEQLIEVDKMLKRLLIGLIKRKLLQCVNIIVIADHGMAESGIEKVIHLDDYIGGFQDKFRFSHGAFGSITLKKNYKELASTLESALSCKRKELRVFKKEDLPKRLHYSNNARIAEYILNLDEGFSVNLNSSFSLKGLHGYDSYQNSMEALFLAYGPSIKPKSTVEPFQNIEIYNLMCHLLGITAAANNGTDGLLYPILNVSPQLSQLEEKMIKELEFPTVSELPSRLNVAECDSDSRAIEPWIKMLDIKPDQKSKIEQEVLPWGAPQLNSSFLKQGLLYHPDHITTYSPDVKLPLWTSFNLYEKPSEISEVHWTSDVRLNAEISPTCTGYNEKFNVGTNFSMMPLFRPEFSKDDTTKKLSSLISNAVPFSEQLQPIWKTLLTDTIPRWVNSSTRPINVILGPLFDANSDGWWDSGLVTHNGSVIPTDFFVIVTKCKIEEAELKNCPPEDVDAVALVFPQHQNIDNCLTNEEFTLEFSAKINDVEKLSGFRFYPKMDAKNRIRLINGVHRELWPLH